MELPFVGMILGSISTVLLPVFSGMDKGEGMGNETLNIWNSALLKSAKLIFPILIFSVFFARPIMTCMYGDMYAQSSIYFVIKNLSGLFYIIPFYPIILAIGKTSAYANVHMVAAFVIVIAEYIVCTICDSAVYVAITSELCLLFKIWLLMKVIVSYAHKKITDLIPPKPMLILTIISVLACVPPFLFIHFVEMNKFATLFLSFGLFLIDYYILCWISKVTYRDIVSGFLKKGSRLASVIKVLP